MTDTNTQDQTKAQDIVVNADTSVEDTTFKYRFKKDELENKRADVEIKAPTVTLIGVRDILQSGDKDQQELLLEALNKIYRDEIGSWVSDNTDASQETFAKQFLTYKNADGIEVTVPSFSWEGIAHTPKADRRSSAIPKEDWEAFAKSYVTVMSAFGKSVQALQAATVVYRSKFKLIQTDKPTIQKLVPQLALYTEHVPKEDGDKFAEILTLLMTKAEEYLKSDDVKKLVDNLGLE
jgi:hypothetical protein